MVLNILQLLSSFSSIPYYLECLLRDSTVNSLLGFILVFNDLSCSSVGAKLTAWYNLG